MNTPAQPELAGSKVRLVPLGEEHLARSLEWVNEPYIMASVLRVTPVTWDDQKRWHAAILADPAKMVYAVLRSDDDLHIGNTGLYNIDRQHRRAEFWIYIGDPACRGIGAASDALGLMRTLAFEHLGLGRLFLHVGVDNRPARSLYSRHGFREEGVLRHHYIIGGKPVDVVVMSQLQHEYDHQKQDS
jgi:RimJ/RimL family protein N-acetyltransferase